MVEIFSRSAQARDPELAPTHLSIFKSYYWHWLVFDIMVMVDYQYEMLLNILFIKISGWWLHVYLPFIWLYFMEFMFQIGVSLSIIQIAYIMEQLLL